MSNYEKQNFVSGQILKAEHLNHMEDGIGQLSEEKADQFTVGEGLQMSEDRVLSAVGGGSGGGSAGGDDNAIVVNFEYNFEMDENSERVYITADKTIKEVSAAINAADMSGEAKSILFRGLESDDVEVTYTAPGEINGERVDHYTLVGLGKVRTYDPPFTDNPTLLVIRYKWSGDGTLSTQELSWSATSGSWNTIDALSPL